MFPLSDLLISEARPPGCYFQISHVLAVCSSVGYLPLCALISSCVKGDMNSTYPRVLLKQSNPSLLAGCAASPMLVLGCSREK